MKTWLRYFFIENWQRKLISFILAMVIWMVVNHSMTVTKTIANIPVRITHLSAGKTIEGMQTNGFLDRHVSLTITGNKTLLDELSEKDLSVEIDAQNKSEEWIAVIEKKNLVSENPELHLDQMISKVAPLTMILHPTKLITEKIPVLITEPIGEAPKGYQFLGCWPYQLYLTINGPELAVKQLKARGLKLTFNLNDISLDELDALIASRRQAQVDEVSFFVPNAWKKISLPQISETPLDIDDAQAKALRIDFARQDLLPISAPLPVTVFCSPKYAHLLSPEQCQLGTSEFLTKKNGVLVLQPPLFVQGVSRLFLDTVKDMIQLVIVAAPKSERETLSWNVQFMHTRELEDRYVEKMLSESGDESSLREEYLRSRFQNYMFRFCLYTQDKKKLQLHAELQSSAIAVTLKN